MDDTTYFERLAAIVSRLARHPYFPAKQEAVELCLEDIEDLSVAGRITAEQAGVLRATLLGSLSRAA
jgi:predicted DNA-binding protein